MLHLEISALCLQVLHSFGMWCVTRYVVPDISEGSVTSLCFTSPLFNLFLSTFLHSEPTGSQVGPQSLITCLQHIQLQPLSVLHLPCIQLQPLSVLHLPCIQLQPLSVLHLPCIQLQPLSCFTYRASSYSPCLCFTCRASSYSPCLCFTYRTSRPFLHRSFGSPSFASVHCWSDLVCTSLLLNSFSILHGPLNT